MCVTLSQRRCPRTTRENLTSLNSFKRKAMRLGVIFAAFFRRESTTDSQMATATRFLQHSSYEKRPHSESESSDSDTGSEVEESHFQEEDPLWQPSGDAAPRHYKAIKKAPKKKHKPSEYTEESPLHAALGKIPESEGETKWHIKLSNSSLWQQFEAVGTEMIIMKSGRRMFPPVIVSVKGLDPESLYSVSLSILPVDEYRYRYRQGDGWTKIGKGARQCSLQTFTHPDSRNLGSHWMRRPISFKTVKLTNNATSIDSDQIILHSMQKYQPCLKITCETSGEVQQCTFPECRFIAVTSYQNSQMTQLKIVNNPYARAFRATTSSPDSSGAANKTRSCSRSSSSVSPHQQTNTSTSEEQDSDHSLVDVTTIDNEDLLFTPQESPFGCPLNYWADENSLYNPTLITPPPMLEPGSSFSEPYLKQLAIEQWRWNSTILSPIKRLDSSSSLDSTQTIDVENTNDVFV